jgi:hypothetical protein
MNIDLTGRNHDVCMGKGIKKSWNVPLLVVHESPT